MHTCAPGVQEAVYHGEESERQPEPATPTAWRSRSGLLSVDAERRWNQRFTAGCERSGLELPLKTTEGSGLRRTTPEKTASSVQRRRRVHSPPVFLSLSLVWTSQACWSSSWTPSTLLSAAGAP